MEAKLQKWGNSDGIRIPNNILKSLSLKTNDLVDLNVRGDEIVITKPKKDKYLLEEEFAQYNGKNLAKEFSWDDSLGREIW